MVWCALIWCGWYVLIWGGFGLIWVWLDLILKLFNLDWCVLIWVDWGDVDFMLILYCFDLKLSCFGLNCCDWFTLVLIEFWFELVCLNMCLIWFEVIRFDLSWVASIDSFWVKFDLILIWFLFDFRFDLIDSFWFWFDFDLNWFEFDSCWYDLIWYDFSLIWNGLMLTQFDIVFFHLWIRLLRCLVWTWFEFDLILTWFNLNRSWLDVLWFDLSVGFLWFCFWFDLVWLWLDLSWDWFELGFILVEVDAIRFGLNLVGFEFDLILIKFDLFWLDGFDLIGIWWDLI